MFKMKSALFALLSTTFLFISAVPALAGGGPIEFSVDPNTVLAPGEQYIVHALVYADGTYPTYCKNCYIKLAFRDSAEGDYIAQNSDKTNDEGRIYAKVISKVAGIRTIYASELRDSNGVLKEANSEVKLNYADGVIDSFPMPEGKISVWILDQQIIAPNDRQISLKFGWTQTAGNVSYNILTKQKNTDWETKISGDRGPSTKINLKANQDYYIKVEGCLDKFGTCEDSDELFVPKLKDPQETDQKVMDKKEPDNRDIVSSDSGQLQQKIDNLEKKLAESEKKQSALEQRLNQIIGWIKSIFPFFK